MVTVPKEIHRLGRFLAYVLGRRPDEFGLVPNDQGFVTTKELLQALHQQDGWRHLRTAHLEQLFAAVRPAPIEIENRLIRAAERDRLPNAIHPEYLPKLLYLAIRRRAYAAVLQKGLTAGSLPHLVLSSDRTMAQTIGQRRDNHPVVLTVQVARSQAEGTNYLRYGETLYLADTIAAGTFTGPAPPKERTPSTTPLPEKTPEIPKTPGSFFPEVDALTSEEKKALKRERRNRKMAQEKARRQARRDKSRRKI